MHLAGWANTEDVTPHCGGLTQCGRIRLNALSHFHLIYEQSRRELSPGGSKTEPASGCLVAPTTENRTVAVRRFNPLNSKTQLRGPGTYLCSDVRYA